MVNRTIRHYQPFYLQQITLTANAYTGNLYLYWSFHQNKHMSIRLLEDYKKNLLAEGKK
jgi:hypothetical protein